MAINKFNTYQAAFEFYNLFFDNGKKMSLIDYLDNSFCDEMVEIDLNKDKINIIYHVENKYFLPNTEDSFTNLNQFITEYLVHPDDKEIYDDLMNPKTILKKLSESPLPYFRFAHLRYKLKNGSYRWIEQAIITGESYGIPENKVRVYVFDIHNNKSRELGQTNDESTMHFDGRDKVTGLLTGKTFYDEVERVALDDKVHWCAISIDIEHFKLFDEWYGRKTGDYLLTRIGSILTSFTHENGGVAGYFGQDDFALLMTYDMKLINQVFDAIRDVIVSFGFSVGFIPAMGICAKEHADNAIDAFDKASIAEYRAKQNVKNRICVYDPQFQVQQEEEYHVLLDFMQALKNDEVTFYLQPQVRISTERVVGAEALARWIKPDGKVVSPAVFVPVLEKYSFITDLDKYIWEKVCKWLREWIDAGHKPVPISINVSQVDIFTINIAEHLKNLVKKYGLEPSQLKIEITESAYAETTSVVGELVNTLRANGFVVLMDDFGSGYSSLNMLRNLKVDAIKLDALFLKINGDDYQRGIHILESVVNMAKTIALPIIVEGIETKEQEDFIINLGGRYAQGFYYHRPMPISDFEDLIRNPENIDDRGFVIKTNEQLQIREFLDDNIYSDTMLNSILGPVAFYAWKGKKVDIVRYNQQFYEAVGASDFAQRLEDIERFLPEEDVPKLYQLLEKSRENKAGGSSGILRFHRVDGVLMTFLMRFYYLGEKGGFSRFYGSASNITKFMDLEQKMSLISQYSSDTIIFLKRVDNRSIFDIAAHGLAKQMGLTLEELSNELENRTFHLRMDPDECLELEQKAIAAYKQGIQVSYTFSFRRPDNKIIKIHLNGDPVANKANNVEYILTFRATNH